MAPNEIVLLISNVSLLKTLKCNCFSPHVLGFLFFSFAFSLLLVISFYSTTKLL